MTLATTLESGQWQNFSIPHPFCLLGEQLHLLGMGSVQLASNLRLQVQSAPGQQRFRLVFSVAGFELGAAARQAAERWRQAVADVPFPEAIALADTELRLHFEPSLASVPIPALLSCPAVAAALAVTALGRQAQMIPFSEQQAVECACQLLGNVRPGGENPRRFIADITMCLTGGASYIGPEGDAVNVQRLLPPMSLILALAPEPAEDFKGGRRDETALQALSLILKKKHNILQEGDAGFAELFDTADGMLDERQIAVLYGLMRLRQMTETFLEHVGGAPLDNDRLAEFCDEESAILTDYFDFPARSFEDIRHKSVEAGALGCKLTWALGGHPAALIIAPGRREQVRQELSEAFEEVRFTPLDIEATGLKWE